MNRFLILLLLLLLLQNLILQAQSQSCATGQIYDDDDVGEWAIDLGWVEEGPVSEWTQLFSAPVIPYQFTSICFWLTSGTSSSIVNISLYEVTPLGTPSLVPYIYETFTVDTSIEDWTSVTPTNFFVYKPNVFIALSYPMESSLTFGYSIYHKPPHLTFRRTNYSLAWENSIADGFYDDYTAWSIRAVGQPVTTSISVPNGWVCDPFKFANGVECDCNCGIWDPDCSFDVKGPISKNCTQNGEVCSPNGTCVVPNWDENSCDLVHFGSNDGCHCGCGGEIDPDCLLNQNAVNCNDSAMIAPICNFANNLCTDSWKCGKTAWNDSFICDCNCGIAIDPDCFIENISSTCNDDNLVCLYNYCRIPEGWQCRPWYFATADGCDCECGAYDLDCDNYKFSVWNCEDSAGYSCNYTGNCVLSGCGNGYVESGLGEQCDGGAFCSSNCSCDKFAHPTFPLRGSCISTCGNGQIDDFEECDSGLGCEFCTCSSNFSKTDPISTNCTQVIIEKVNLLAIILPSIFGGLVLIAGIISTVFVANYCRKRGRKDPKQINLPVESTGVEFVTVEPGHEDKNSAGDSSQYNNANSSVNFQSAGQNSTATVPQLPQTPQLSPQPFSGPFSENGQQPTLAPIGTMSQSQSPILSTTNIQTIGPPPNSPISGIPKHSPLQQQQQQQQQQGNSGVGSGLGTPNSISGKTFHKVEAIYDDLGNVVAAMKTTFNEFGVPIAVRELKPQELSPGMNSVSLSSFS